MKTRILVADDNERVVDVLARVLSGPETEVSSVTDGSLVVSAARSARPDLVILDVAMPGLNGFEVCAALRREEQTRDIPIMMLTGLGDVHYELQGLNAGADRYVSKPFNAAYLRAQVDSLLRRREIDQDRR